jgi:hypothetical protein
MIINNCKQNFFSSFDQFSSLRQLAILFSSISTNFETPVQKFDFSQIKFESELETVNFKYTVTIEYI